MFAALIKVLEVKKLQLGKILNLTCPSSDFVEMNAYLVGHFFLFNKNFAITGTYDLMLFCCHQQKFWGSNSSNTINRLVLLNMILCFTESDV